MRVFVGGQCAQTKRRAGVLHGFLPASSLLSLLLFSCRRKAVACLAGKAENRRSLTFHGRRLRTSACTKANLTRWILMHAESGLCRTRAYAWRNLKGQREVMTTLANRAGLGSSACRRRYAQNLPITPCQGRPSPSSSGEQRAGQTRRADVAVGAELVCCGCCLVKWQRKTWRMGDKAGGWLGE